MGGGGTTVASGADPSLKVSIGTAPWLPNGLGVQPPTLLMCGDIDFIASCDVSESASNEISESMPQALRDHPGRRGPPELVRPPATPASVWVGNTGSPSPKMFLEDDERWRSALLGLGGDVTSNIQ